MKYKSEGTFPQSGKIKVTPEESVIVQEALFRDGFVWNAGQNQELLHVEQPYLFWGQKNIFWDDVMSVFDECADPEYTMSLFTDPKQSEDVWNNLSSEIALILIDRDPYATNYDLTKTIVAHLKKYHITKKP